MTPTTTIPAMTAWQAAQTIKRVIPRGQADADELHALVVLLEDAYVRARQQPAA